ncbi:unnamed protein product (macronuclear) [Paramecium tetraurelia]|uniref:G domain-containing protein n=1 Tax=Paramecium tetraurelia TaxID=5888 RepID=A0EE47_PARTE|nr:uncharacterized protein GSPATT00025908001 [Paramecium tetraurelia]CAK93564.1 unnamed protein product [Paramecium tetraurelia]|eukprot:XP_001460961.1 hypothetical protein (macronuclear) [Paramecium tetraurelia strain d4-2]
MGVCCINPQKSQEDQSVMILFFLSEENQQIVQQQFKDVLNFSFEKLMIFSDFRYYQSRLFISNGKLLPSPDDFKLYLGNCCLEGNLRQIVVLVDLKTCKNDFNQFSYVKRLQQNDQFKDITSLFFLNSLEENITQKDNGILNQLGLNFQKIQSFQLKETLKKTLDSQNYVSKQIQYNLPTIKQCETCQEMVKDLINEKKKFYQTPSCGNIDLYFKLLIDLRNQVVYSCPKCNNRDDKKHRNALYFKFNIEIIKLIQNFTQNIFQQIEIYCKRFQFMIKCCSICKTIFYQNSQKYPKKIEFFNNLQNNCNSCKFQENKQEIQLRYKSQLEFFSMNTIIKKLQTNLSYLQYSEIQKEQSIIIQMDKHDLEKLDASKIQPQNSNLNLSSPSPSKIIEKQNKNIMLIGMGGVGKTYIYNKLSENNDCQQKYNEFTQKSVHKNKELQNSNNSSFNVIDTPPFELVDENQMPNSQKIDWFGNCFTKNKVSKIFIVTNYGRIEIMKKKIMDCYKFLKKFQKILIIIILNLQTEIELKQSSQEMVELEQYFELECIYFNQVDNAGTFREKIANTIYSSTDEYLDLDDTKFDKKKNQLMQSQFEEKFTLIKNQQQILKIQENIQMLMQQNKEKEVQKRKITQKKKELEIEKQQLLNYLQHIFQKIENLVNDENELQTQDQRIDQEQNELEMDVLRLEKRRFELKCKKD